jgi:lipopolysaccharide export system permease protein
MRIVSRYVFRQAAGALLLILLSLSGVVWIALALRQLNVVTSQGQDAMRLLAMTTLALPNMMALIAPIALLIATIHTLNRLNGDSELIVLTAGGGTVWSLAKPLVLLALLVSIGVSTVNHFVMPWSLRMLRELIVEVRTDLLTQVIQPGRFNSPEPSLTFHIRDRALNGELQGILLHDLRDPKQPLSYLAERGNIIKQDASAYLLMQNGHIIRRPDPTDGAQIIAFESFPIDLTRFEQKQGAIELRPRERYFEELARPHPDDPAFKQSPGQFRAELHERFSNPLYPFAFVLLALAFAGQAESTRQSRVQNVVIAFLLAIGIRLAGLAVNNLVVLKPQSTTLLYVLPLSGIGIGLTMMVMGTRRRLQTSIPNPLAGLIERLSPSAGGTPSAATAARQGGGR